MAEPLLSADAPSRRLIADKAYDEDSLRKWLDARHIKAVIPSTASRTLPYPLDRRAYKRGNVIERLFVSSAVPVTDGCRAAIDILARSATDGAC